MSKPTPDATMNQQVGRALQQARLQRGITQAELARALNVKRVTVSRWERGARSLDLTMLVTIGRLLQVNPATLLPTAGVSRTLEQSARPPHPQAERPATLDTNLAQAITLLQEHAYLAPSVIELIQVMAEDPEPHDGVSGATKE